jgi:23S rRNA pseudouridine2605 synthase
MSNFKKYIKPELKGAKKKEAIKQQKRKARQEKREWFEAKKEEKRNEQKQMPAGKEPVGQRPRISATKKTNKPVGAPTTAKTQPGQGTPGTMPLNKYLAHSGICSRREAAGLVKEGKVKVNDQVQTDPAYKMQPGDTVSFNGKPVMPQQQMVYILLNKPKDHITTSHDEKGRKTVFDAIWQATGTRLFPVGRLDRNTTGVLLLTNDGDLTQKLTHPKYNIKKVYEVKLDKPCTKAHLDQLAGGIELEDGFIAADGIAYADAQDKSVVGIEIHSGKNRIVRRMFEHLGYRVKGLDRVMFGLLTKKNVDRGKWRHLSEKEVRLLKHFK